MQVRQMVTSLKPGIGVDRQAASAGKPHPEAGGLVLLALAVIFQAVLLRPEARIERVQVNDLVFHLAASQRLGESIARGEPFMDPWVSQWSLGYPVWRVYQPLPHLLAAAVIALAWPFASPAASFAAMYYVLLVFLPVSFYLGARLIGLNPLASGLASILILAPSEVGDLGRYGAGYGAYVWRGSGLFTQLVAFELLLPTLGLVAQAIDSGRKQTSAALGLALTTLSHTIFGYIAFVSTLIWALTAPGGDRSRRIARAASVGARAILLLAWFVLPMLLAGGEINRCRWEPIYKFDSYGARIILGELFSGRLLDFGRAPILSSMVVAGALIAAFKIRDSMARRLLVLAGAWLILYFGRETWGHLLMLAGIPIQLPAHRLESAFELFAVLLAAWGLERIIAAAIRAPWLITIFVGAALAGLVILLGVERGRFLSLNAIWGERNLAAFERERGDLDLALADVRAIVAQRPGRVSAGKASQWGSGFVVGEAKVFSFLTRDGFDQASFLYHAMSLTADFVELRNENDPAHEDLFGIRAVLAPAGLNMPFYLRKRSVHGRFAVYEASSQGYFGLVDIGARYDGGAATWFEPVSRWLGSLMLYAGEVIALDPRHDQVPRVGRWEKLPNPAPGFAAARGRILAESKVGETYRATIAAERPCYALIKITYHPDLVAWVDGKRAKLVRVSPDFGAIGLSAGHHEVAVRYQPGPLKPLLLLAGVALFILAARPSVLSAWQRGEQWLGGRLALCGEWLTTDRAKTVFALLLLVLLFTRALFRGRLIAGHDSLEYPPRLAELAKTLGDRELPPLWAPDLTSGHGQPLFEFAPPLVYVTALPFFTCGMGLADSLQLGLVILFAFGAAAVYLLGRKLSFSPIASVGGAAAWLFAPYQALDLFVCARFAESSALAVAPLALLGLITAMERRTAVSIALGAAAIALVPLAHNAVALLIFPIFGVIVVARSVVSVRPVRTVAAGASAIAGGLGLSAFFWLPALLEKDFVKTELLRTGFLNWSNYIISPLQLLWSPWGFGYAMRGPGNGISYSLGLLHIALAIAGAVIGIRAVSRTRRLDAAIFAAAATVGALLATEWSSPIWARVAALQYLAYPWRTLCVPALFMPLLALYVFERIGPKASVLLILLVVLVNLHHTEPKGYLTYDDEYFYPASIAEKGLNTTTREEYEPRWVQVRPPYTGNRLVGSDGRLAVGELSWTSARHAYSVLAPGAQSVVDSTSYYPGWTVMIDGHEAETSPAPWSGLISFTVPAGQHTIIVELRQTRVRHYASVISLFVFGLLLVLAACSAASRRAVGLLARPRAQEDREALDELAAH